MKRRAYLPQMIALVYHDLETIKASPRITGYFFHQFYWLVIFAWEQGDCFIGQIIN